MKVYHKYVGKVIGLKVSVWYLGTPIYRWLQSQLVITNGGKYTNLLQTSDNTLLVLGRYFWLTRWYWLERHPSRNTSWTCEIIVVVSTYLPMYHSAFHVQTHAWKLVNCAFNLPNLVCIKLPLYLYFQCAQIFSWIPGLTIMLT